MTALLVGLPLGLAPAAAQTELTGMTGYLSEWQFSVALKTGSPYHPLSAPITWKHIGLCSANGTLEKQGDIDVRIHHLGPWSRINVSVSFEKLRCTYSGRYAERVTGFMACSDK